MRFLINGGFNNSRPLQIILVFTLIYVTLLWVTNLLLYIEKIGFTYTTVVDYYLGSEGEFKNPVSYMGLLEITHFHLMAFAFVLLLVNHLMAFLDISDSIKLPIIFVSFVSGLGDMGAGWLVRFVSPTFAYLKIGSFVVFQISLLFLLAFSFLVLGVYRKEGKRGF